MWWREAIRTSTLPLSPVVWECRGKMDTTWEGWEWESSVLREQPSRKIEGVVREEGDLPDGCLWVPESTGKGASDTGRERVRSKVKKKVWKRLFGHKSWRNEKWLGLLIVSVVNRNKRYNEISPDIPRLSIGNGMGGRQCGYWSTQCSGSSNRLLLEGQSNPG